MDARSRNCKSRNLILRYDIIGYIDGVHHLLWGWGLGRLRQCISTYIVECRYSAVHFNKILHTSMKWRRIIYIRDWIYKRLGEICFFIFYFFIVFEKIYRVIRAPHCIYINLNIQNVRYRLSPRFHIHSISHVNFWNIQLLRRQVIGEPACWWSTSFKWLISMLF